MNITDYTNSTIDLQDLPQWSPWPKRIMQLDEWQTPDRTTKEVDRVYDQEEYARCLHYAEEHTDATPDQIKEYEFNLGDKKSVCMSHHNKLYEVPAEKVMAIHEQLLLDALSPYIEKVDTVVEIGCGYGFNLWVLQKAFPTKKYKGGEYSPNGVKIGDILYKHNDGISLEVCNFYDPTLHILEECSSETGVLLFTRHAIEQLPSVASPIKTLLNYTDRIATCVHMEPMPENCDDSLLGLLRRRYSAINDYNQDLVSILEAEPSIKILKNEYDILGQNPLNPTSSIVWQTT